VCKYDFSNPENDIEEPYKFNEAVGAINDYTQLFFSFRFLNLNESIDHSFKQKKVNKEHILDIFDCLNLFEKLKNYSEGCLKDFIDNSNYKEHFRIISSNFKLKILLEKVTGKKIKDQNCPHLGEFALYTNNVGNADRSKNIKSPRIYFFIGPNGVMYIFGYDPYHELFDNKKKN